MPDSPNAGGDGPPRHDPGHDERFRQGWGSSARIAASSTLRAAMSDKTELLPACEAAGEAFVEIFRADAVSVTLMDRLEYCDIVNVGWLEPGQVRFPVDQRYPTSTYPATTRRLLELEGYISTDSELDVVREYIEGSPFNRMGCFMGVPIVAAAEVHGEVFLWRDEGHPPFTSEDLPVAYDLATQFGGHLPALIRAQTETQRE